MPSVEVLFYLLVNEPVVQLSQVGGVTRFGYIFAYLALMANNSSKRHK